MQYLMNKETNIINQSSLVNSHITSEKEQIAEYIKTVNKFPILTEQEEHYLLTEFFENQNLKAGHQILNSHLRLVVKIAIEYKKYHNSLMDLIAEGNLGLLKALQKFSFQKNVRFSTYALLWVKASIQNFLTQSISSVKAITTNVQKKLLFNFSKAKKSLGINAGKNLNTEELKNVSNMLGVTANDIKDYENMMHSIQELSTNDTMQSQDSEHLERGNLIPSKDLTPEASFEKTSINAELKHKVNFALSQLSKREAEIIKYRVLNSEKYTLAELSKKFAISKERIRQIQDSGLKKLKKILQNEITPFITS
jgi:RNA polymerase sigma-32 factor